MNKKFLVVKLDQYAGNVDEIVSVALTGCGRMRHGYEEAEVLFNEKMVPLLGGGKYPELPVSFMEFGTEYGDSPYELDDSGVNNLRLGIDDYTQMSDLKEMIAVWKQAYGLEDGTLEIKVEFAEDKASTIKVLGFNFVSYIEKREEVE